jgi:hypothetical protein
METGTRRLTVRIRSEGLIRVSYLVAVLVVALCIRLLPYALSPMPYNIDGLSEVRVTQDIMATGGIEFVAGTSQDETYVTDMPISGLFVAFVSSSLDVGATMAILLIEAIIGAVAIAVISLAISRHLPNPRSSFASAIVLALLGSLAFSAGCTWKETLGIFLLGVVLVSCLRRDERRYRMLLLSSLVLLVFTHHHAAVVTFVVVTFAFLISAYNHAKRREHWLMVYADLATSSIAWIVAVLYYSHVSLPYLDYLSPQTSLYLYAAVAFLVLLVGLRASRRMYVVSQLPLGVIVPLLGVSFLFYNFYDPIFPGIPAPSLSIAIPFLAYLILVVPAWYGSELLLGRNGPSKDLLLAMLLGPVSLILFAFLRSNDSTSYLIVYRTFDFLIIPFALLVGAGFAYLVKGRERLGVLAGISLVVICASTLPVAYQTEELFGVQNHTFEYEYDAVQWFSVNGIDNYTSDQRLGETGWRLFDIDFQRGLPYDLREGIPLDEGSFYVLEESWSTDGAQEFPFGVVVVDAETVSSVLGSSSVVYVGGPAEDQFVCFAA